MKSVLRILMLVLVLAPAVVDAAKPMNLKNESFSVKVDGTSFTPQEVQAIIIESCFARGWSPLLGGEGMIHATINVGDKHFAEVEIPYTSATYSILYVSSKNLQYDASRPWIHRRYNSWVVKLSETIKENFRTASIASYSPDKTQKDVVAERNQDDVYSKILMLDDMRERGILTDEEFDAEKKKLLNGN